MARRTFDVIDVTEILVHWHAGRSLNEMSQSLGVDRKTIRKYVAPGATAPARSWTSTSRTTAGIARTGPLGLRPPDGGGATPVTDLATAPIRRQKIPGGLIHEYEQAA
jgi:hypothetical protein